MNNQIMHLRELTKKYLEIANMPIEDKKRHLWRNLNSLNMIAPTIYIRAFAFNEWFDDSKLICTDPLFRMIEKKYHQLFFQSKVNDDYILEPFIIINADFKMSNHLRWGVLAELGEKVTKNGAAAYKPSIIDEEDIELIKPPKQEIDEEKTAQKLNKLNNAIGDLIPIFVDRQSIFHRMWSGMDISTDLARIRGLEQIMWDMFDRPQWLESLVSKMANAITQTLEESEKNNNLSFLDSQNQAMAYSNELHDPNFTDYGIKRSEMWGFMASQEFTTIGPEQFDTFLLKYQKPILEKFGLSAYGCCEDLTQKIDKLRTIKNLRRIALSPFANVESVSSQVGRDYVLSYRPNPSDMISNGLDEEYVRKKIRSDFEILKQNQNIFDITLKDVETVNNKPDNVVRFVEILREEIDRTF